MVAPKRRHNVLVLVTMQGFAKGGLIPTPRGSVAPDLADDECFVRFPDDDEATWAPCVRRDPAHREFGCPGGMTVPARRTVRRILRGLNAGSPE